MLTSVLYESLQGLITPQTGLTDVSVGSAIRQVTPAPVGVLDLSPAVPDMPEASPTLMLLPGGPGLSDTPVNLQVLLHHLVRYPTFVDTIPMILPKYRHQP